MVFRYLEIILTAERLKIVGLINDLNKHYHMLESSTYNLSVTGY